MTGQQPRQQGNCPLTFKEWIVVLSGEINKLKYPDLLPFGSFILVIMIFLITFMVNTSLSYSNCIASNSTNSTNSKCELAASLTVLSLNIYYFMAIILFIGLGIGVIIFLIEYINTNKKIKAYKNIMENIISGETDSNKIRKEWEKINMTNKDNKKYLTVLSFIVILFVATLIFNYQWLTSNYQWLISSIIEIAVAAGTLLLAYMAYQQMKDSNEKIHTSNLKDIIRLWLENLRSNKVVPAEETFTFGRLDSIAPLLPRGIENHTLFEDIFHHFPDLRDFWNESKTLSLTYSSERQGFFDKIEEHIKQKLKEHNFHYQSENYNFDIESIVKGFILSVYIDIVRITKGKNNVYDYSTQQVSVKGIVKNQLNYGVIGMGTQYILAYIESERINEVKNIHKEMIKECKEIYLSDRECNLFC